MGSVAAKAYVTMLAIQKFDLDPTTVAYQDIVGYFLRPAKFNGWHSNDFARLDQANVFCKEGSTCDQSFTAGVDVETLMVHGNVVDGGEAKTVLGVDIAGMDSNRFSLSRTETVSGDYKFKDLSANSFTGPISYNYEGRDQSFFDYVSKFLKKTDSASQTFTKFRTFGQLKSSGQVVTGSGDVTKDLTLNWDNVAAKEDADSNHNIKNIYTASFQLDAASNTVPSTDVEFTFTNNLQVSKNVAVSGTVETVDLEALVKDLVIQGEDVSIPETGVSLVGECFQDSAQRVLPDVAVTIQELTVEKCLTHCWDLGYVFAGVQFSSECYCSQNPPTPYTPVASSECNMACTGDADQTCGGSLRINVYSKHYTITGTSNADLKLTGTKTFSKSPTVQSLVSQTIDALESKVYPVIVYDNDGAPTTVNFDNLDGSSRVLEKDGVSTWKGMTGKLTINGDIQINGNLRTDTIDGVTVSSINDNYVYHPVDGIHEIKTAFVFGGALTVTDLTCPNIRGRSWADFVADIIPLTSESPIVITGDKQFTSTVELTKTDTSVSGTVNTVDLGDMATNLAYIDTATTFSGATNAFTSETSSSITGNAVKLTATSKLTLSNSVVGTDFDIDWVHGHTIPKDSAGTHVIAGKLTFNEDLTLSADSTVGSLGDSSQSLAGIQLPEDLILLNTNAVITSLQGNFSTFIIVQPAKLILF